LEVSYSITTEENEKNEVFRSVEVSILVILAVLAIVFLFVFVAQRRRLNRDILEQRELIRRRKHLS
jgi:hypothetical protein